MHRISEFSTFVEKVPIFEARKEGFGDPRGLRGGEANLLGIVRCMTLRKVCLKTSQAWLTSEVERIEVQGIEERKRFISKMSA